MTPTTVTAQAVESVLTKIDEQLEAKLERYLVLKDINSEFEKLKKELKPVFEGTEKITIGRFTVTGKYVSQPPKQMPAFTYWDMRVKQALDYTLTLKGNADGQQADA